MLFQPAPRRGKLIRLGSRVKYAATGIDADIAPNAGL